MIKHCDFEIPWKVCTYEPLSFIFESLIKRAVAVSCMRVSAEVIETAKQSKFVE